MHGHNTDAPGFDRFLRRDAGFDPAGPLRADVRGRRRRASGGARARRRGRRPAHGGRARGVPGGRAARRGRGLGHRRRDGAVRRRRRDAGRPRRQRDPAGRRRGHGAADPGARARARSSSTCSTGRSSTPLQLAARAAGAEAFGGLGLLLHQAALSFELWTGTPAPLDAMSAAALVAIDRRSLIGRSGLTRLKRAPRPSMHQVRWTTMPRSRSGSPWA